MFLTTTLKQPKGNWKSLTHLPIPEITNQLHDLNWRIRQQAVTVLSGTHDQGHIERLIACLSDSHIAVRTAAIKALVVSDTIAVPLLINFLKDAENPLTQTNCARVLGRIGNLLATDPLIAILTAQDDDTRRYSAEALGLLRNPQAVEPLIAALTTEKSPSVMMAIATALGRLADPHAVDTLIDCLSHPNQMLLLATTWALSKIGDPRAIPPMIEVLRHQCLEIQGRTAWGDDTIEDKVTIAARIQMYGGGHANMPENIAAMIARFGESAITHLNKLSQEADPTTRLYATFALSEISHPRAIESLIPRLKDPSANVRAMIISALCRIGDPDMIPHIMSVLNDTDPRVCSIATAGLKKLENRT